MTDRDRFALSLRVPSRSTLHFAADPGHSPARESQDRATCSECGGVTRDRKGREIPNRGRKDPVRESPVALVRKGIWKKGKANTSRLEYTIAPTAVVCGGCGRSVYDGTPALAAAVKPGDGEDRDKADSTEAKAGPRAKGR